MNARCFRLVSSRLHGMLVPVGENASAVRGKRRASAAGLVSAVLLGAAAAAVADSTLPVPSLAIDSANIAASGAATAAISNATLTVDQSSLRAVINWQSFNVGSGATVQFNHQQGAGSATLNQIHDINPSVIQGSIRAAGDIYLFNQNGILFKDGARVDVGSLFASTLQVNGDAFSRGFLSLPIGANAQAAFTWGGTKAEFETSLIEVSPGAALNASTGGRVMVLAPKVINRGTISAPEGQVVLGGGAKVFLTAPLDATLRGFLVEVDPYQTFDGAGTPTDVVGGTVTNEATGRVLVDRGNATLAGFGVNQNGRVSATTSVSVNGSVFLQARDQVSQSSGISTVTVNGNVVIPRGQRTGTVTFGPGSTTEVLPQVGDRTTTQDAQGFTPSRIDVVGRRVILDAGSLLRAPAGEVTISAQTAPLFQVPGSPAVGDVRVYVAPGARIDVSGTQGVTLSVERNFIDVELRGNELRDSPLLRDSFVRGQKVTVDIRKGTPIGDVSGFVNQVARAVDERTAGGGTITLRSEGDVILREGSVLDVSGSVLTYREGRAAETRLLGADGRSYAMSEATLDRLYTGFADRAPETDVVAGRATGLLSGNKADRPIVAGYTEGRSAGSIAVVSHGTVLDGALVGRATAGEFQRTAALAPQGGQLLLGDLSADAAVAGDSKLRGLAFVAAPQRLASTFNADAVLEAPWRDRTMLNPGALFQTGGFTRLGASSNGAVTIETPITLAPWGSLSLAGRTVAVSANITAPGGTVSLATQTVSGEPLTDPSRFVLNVASGVRIDTAGTWTNDRLSLNPAAPRSALVVDGGSISLRGEADVRLAGGSVLDVSGGARVDEAGRLTAGDAGRISITTGRLGLGDADPQVSTLTLGGDLRGFAVVQPTGGVVGTGGELVISTSRIVIGASGTGATGELHLAPAFFDRGGFTNFTLNGQDGLLVADGAVVTPRVSAWQVDGGAIESKRTGTPMFRTGPDSAVTNPLTGGLRQWSRLAGGFDDFVDPWSPTAIVLRSDSAARGHVEIGRNAIIEVDPLGSIAIESGRRVTVLGGLSAPGGAITIGNVPPGSNDTFESDVSVWIGSTARIFAQGVAQSRRNSLGFFTGVVHDGGRISINAAKGSVVLEAGSVLDVSGVVSGTTTAGLRGPRVEDVVDVPVTGVTGVTANGVTVADLSYRRTAVASAAGEIRLVAREGIIADGAFRAAPGRTGQSGGALYVAMTAAPQFAFPATEKRIVVSNGAGVGGNATFLPPGAVPGAPIPTTVGGVDLGGGAYLSADRITDAGFSTVTLMARDRIEFSDTLALSPGRSLTLDAPEIRVANGSAVSLDAAAVTLGSTDLFRQLQTAPVAGSGTLDVEARVVDLVGRVNLTGVDRVSLRSSSGAGVSGGDIRLRGVLVDTLAGEGVAYRLIGGLTTAASLVQFEAERIAPTTATSFTVRTVAINSGTGAVSTDGTIEFLKPAIAGPTTPLLSAAGELLVQARTIRQETLVAAPFGSIRFEATDSVTLGAGSVTSASGNGQAIPFGQTELSGKDYVYDLGDGFGNLVITTPPEKRIEMAAPTVTLAAGARIDLSGGGDLLAYEFVPGPGGSADILNPGASAARDPLPGSFAILPGMGAAYGPYDHQLQQGTTGLNVGDQIELKGVAGLPDGVYTLLPRAYASLPGAFLVTPSETPVQDLPFGAVTPRYAGPVTGDLSNVQLVAGYRTAREFDGTVIRDERTSLFTIHDQRALARLAEYTRTSVGSFFSGTTGAQMPADAGRLVLETNGALTLAGTIAGSGARGLQVDIAAPAIRVHAAGDAPVSGFLNLDVARLNALGASSLLLGGTRSTSGGLTITPGSGSGAVIIANRADTPLLAADLMLVSAGDIQIAEGAVLRATGTGAPTPATIAIAGNGAFVRVSTAPVATVVRSAFDRAAGTLTVAGNAVLDAGASVILDATRTTTLATDVQIEATAVSLAAGRIDLGAAVPATDGLVIGGDLLERLGRGDALALKSYSTIDLYGANTIGEVDADGRPLLASLTLDAPAMNAFGAGDKVFRAGTMVLTNSSGIVVSATGTGTGNLRFEALGDGTATGGTLTLGPGAVSLGGADIVVLVADRQVRIAGTGDISSTAGELRIVTPTLTAAAAADGRVTSSGLLALQAPATPLADAASPGLGARLALVGARIDVATRIDLPSGVVDMTATGAGADDAIRLLNGGAIDVSGTEVLFTPGVTRVTDGGTVRLRTAGGGIAIAAGSSIDISAGGNGAKAGLVEMQSGRSLALGGTMNGAGGGSIAVDIAEGGDLNAFAASALAGGFSGAQRYRVRTGDLALGADRTMTAREIRLAADAGAVTVAGTLDASAGKGGRIEVWASGNVTTAGSSRLLARATGGNGDGGLVFLGTSAGAIAVQSGTTIDVSAAGNGAAGEVWLRAPRTTGDVAITALAPTLIGTDEVIIEAFRVYSATTIGTAAGSGLNISNTGGTASLFNETRDYLAVARPAVATRLGGDATIRLRPGIEVRGNTISLAADWNFYCGTAATCAGTNGVWSFDGEPGVLTLRSQGNVALNRTLNDGFRALPPATPTTASITVMNDAYVPRAGGGWSYRVVAGADTGSADVLATVAGAEADVTLAAGRLVRTSDGFIDVVAARDVVLTDARAVMYSAGEPGAAVTGFIVPNPPAVAGTARAHTPTYTEGGGDVRLVAGRDLRGASSGRSVTEWLYRDVRRNVRNEILPNPQTTWWVRYDAFQEGVGALGGGDVLLEAGRDIANVSGAVPTNARLGGDSASAPLAENFVELGGGDLTVRAGRDLLSGLYVVQRGIGDIQAGRDVGSATTVADTPLNAMFALGDASIGVRAGRDAAVEGVFNPTIQRQPRGNIGTTGLLTSYFLTYGEGASFDLSALTGSARLSNNRDLLPQISGSPLASFGSAGEAASSVIYPGTVRVAALSGDVQVGRAFFMAPDRRGQFELLAATDVTVDGRIVMSDVSPLSLPAPLSPDRVYANSLNPLIVQASEQGALFHDEQVLHAGDTTPIRIVAARGDVRGPVDPQIGVSQLGVFAKSMTLVAGRDIVDTWVIGQNVNATDITRIEAGRDLRFNTLRDPLGNQRSNLSGIQWGGPGELQINTGRDVDLGNSLGILTRGNLDNPFLPESGAAIRVSTGGLAPDYAGFLDTYLSTDLDRLAAQFPLQVRQFVKDNRGAEFADTPAGRASALEALRGLGGPAIAAFVESVSYRTELVAWMRSRTGDPNLSADDAVAAFRAMDRSAQTAFVNSILFNELRLAGNPGSLDTALPGFEVRGYRAMAALYPVDPDVQAKLTESNFLALVGLLERSYGKNVKPLLAEMARTGAAIDPNDGARGFASNYLEMADRYAGDVNLFFSQIKTEQGGAIELRVPGGLVNAGLANPGALSKGASSLGIVTVRGGSVEATVLEDFLVNQSRVFTLGGGDINLWASFGNIDAGKGAKTATATPPPQIVIRDGKFVLDTSRSISGSGIGVLLSRADVPPGSAALITPLGEVDAGDAGVSVAGDLVVRAQTVANAANITVGGTSGGVPAATPSLSIGLSGTSSTESQTTAAVARAAEAAAAESAANAMKSMPSFITVQVLGYGDD
jgi:filamentous hemagglutinin